MKRPLRLTWPALVGLLASIPLAKADCSEDNPCTEGCCSSISLVCGYGPQYCGSAACIPAASTNGSCAQISECDPGVYPGWGTVWGSDYASEENCPLNVCCSEFGFCGTTSDFCGETTVSEPTCSGASASTGRSIAYYEGWSQDRPCDTMTPEKIPIGGYTHVFFAFLYIDPVTYEIASMESNQVDLYSRITALKEDVADLEVWISIGGWSFTDPGATQETFTTLAASESLQATFFASVTSFLEQYGFDGVDMDWEYPGAPDRGGQTADFVNYPAFMSNLKDALGGNYGLSMTLPASYWYLQYFDIVTLSGIVDFFNMMSYDMHGSWDATDVYVGSVINPHTNLTEIQSAFDLLWRNNIDPSMVNMGLAFYGRSFTLLDDSCTTPGICNFTSGGNPGACTATSGILSFTEIEGLLADPANGAVMTLDEDAAVQIITFGGNQWVSYDNNVTFNLKMAWADSHCLGGTLVWAVDLDIDGSATSALRNTSDVWVDDDGSGGGAGDVYVGPDLWTNDTQSIGCTPPCTFVLPPFPIGSTTTIADWPAITTTLAVSAAGTTSTVTTTIIVEPFEVTAIPWWPVTVVTVDPTVSTFSPEQSIAPPSIVITLPGSVNAFPVTSTDYTSLALSPSSTGIGAGFTSVSTPSPVQTGITSGCTKFYEVQSGDTCYAIAQDNGITLDEFYAWNPAVGQCTDLELGVYYCISITTGASTVITTPVAVQTGITSNCIKFYYSQDGDSCASVASANDISEADFIQWNPAVGTECTNFWLSEYYCVEVSSTSTVKSTTSPIVWYSTSHKITIQPQPTYTKINPSKTPPPVTYTKGKDPSTGGCSAVNNLLGLCGTHDCSLFGCSGHCGIFGCDGGCGLLFCGGGCGLGECGPGCGDGSCINAGDIEGDPNDECTELTTTSICTEIISSFTTAGTWSTETKTHCEITEACSVVGTTVTTTETTSASFGTITASLWEYAFVTGDDAAITAAASSIRSEQSAMDATRWGAVVTSTPTCNIAEDPDSGIGAYCICSGYASTLSTLSGTSPCAYTSLPGATTTAKATTTKPYTWTDPYGDVIVCSSSSTEVLAGISVTLCEGTITTLVTGTPPVTTTPVATPTSTPSYEVQYFLQEEEYDPLDGTPNRFSWAWVGFAKNYGDSVDFCGDSWAAITVLDSSANPGTTFPDEKIGPFDIDDFDVSNCLYTPGDGDVLGSMTCDGVDKIVCVAMDTSVTDTCTGFPTNWLYYPSAICSW
ncbi:hypothetical protein BX600DRAFT_400333 [Xylariales sp. PMI_506]|nr:hypothetical protein BX600DRAFT_400333 [Xylariales sp. PMI_506]